MMPNSINGFTPEIVSWYEAFLENFPGEQRRKSNTDTDVLCPAHDDHNPSLGVDLRENDRGPKIIMNCRSQGCEYKEILDAAGLSAEDLAYQENGRPKGCTLEEYAAAKGLPIEFLEGDTVGLRDTTWWSVDAVEVPYVDEDGEYVLSRYRVALTGKTKVVSKNSDPIMLYGLHWLEDAQEAGYALLVEGESDCHSAWYRGIPAIGIPGAKNWKDEWAGHLDGIPRILVLVEPDSGGKGLWETVSATRSLRGRVERIDP
jgi:putative DNA primase/helicase